MTVFTVLVLENTVQYIHHWYSLTKKNHLLPGANRLFVDIKAVLIVGCSLTILIHNITKKPINNIKEKTIKIRRVYKIDSGSIFFAEKNK